MHNGPEAPLYFVTPISRITDMIEYLNQDRFHRLQEAICSRLGIPVTRSGCKSIKVIAMLFHPLAHLGPSIVVIAHHLQEEVYRR